MGSLTVARSNGYLYRDARCNDIVLCARNPTESILFGTQGDALSALTISSNYATFTDVVALSNASAGLALLYVTDASGASPVMDLPTPGPPGCMLVADTPHLTVRGDASVCNLQAAGALLPAADHTGTLGASNRRFREAWVDTLHLASNTLYLGDTAVLGTEANTVSMRADGDQSIVLSTSGTGSTTVTSAASASLTASGVNGQATLQAVAAGGRVAIGAAADVVVTAPLTTLNGNATVVGALTVNGTAVFNGSNFTANAQTVNVMDNILLINSGQVGNGVSAGQAGMRVDRGDAPDYMLVYDEPSQALQAGPIGDTQPLVTQPVLQAHLSNAAIAACNLSDLPSATAARGSLGLGATCNVQLGALALDGVTDVAAAVVHASNVAVSASNTAEYSSNAAAYSSNAHVSLSNLTRASMFAFASTTNAALTSGRSIPLNTANSNLGGVTAIGACNSFTAPATGVYHLNATINLASANTSTTTQPFVYMTAADAPIATLSNAASSAAVLTAWQSPMSLATLGFVYSTNCTASLSAMARLTAGQAVQCFMIGPTGLTLEPWTNGSGTQMWGRCVSAG